MKENMLKVLIGLRKSGVNVHLTEAGIQEFMRLMQDELDEDRVVTVENVG